VIVLKAGSSQRYSYRKKCTNFLVKAYFVWQSLEAGVASVIATREKKGRQKCCNACML
jgi:hypothetical protein